MGGICCKDSSESVSSVNKNKSVSLEDEDVLEPVIEKKEKKGNLVGELLTAGDSDGLKFTEDEREFVNIWKTNDGTRREAPTAEHGECSVCFEPLSENKPTLMQKASGRRSCRHFVCFECAEDLLETSKSCPLCREAFENICEVPALLESPEIFFEMLGDENKHLSKDDVLLALNAILPISSGRISMDVKLEWGKWDPENRGYLTMEQAKESICHYVARKIHLPRFQKGAIPDISKPENPGLWFDYWDWDNRGRLAKHEIARAMLKTFSQLLQGKRGQMKIKQMCQTLLVDIWPILSLKDSRYIELDEFISEDGLANLLMQLLWQTMNEAPSPEDLAEMGLDSNKFDIPVARPKVKAKKPNRKHARAAPKCNIDERKPVRPPNSIKNDRNAYVEPSEGKREQPVGYIPIIKADSKCPEENDESAEVSEMSVKDILAQRQKIQQQKDITAQVEARFPKESAFEQKVAGESKESSDDDGSRLPRNYSKPFAEPIAIMPHSSKEEVREEEGKAEVVVKVLSSQDGSEELFKYLRADGLPLWWIRSKTKDGRMYYQNNMEKHTAWEPPTEEQIRKEYESGAGEWYRQRQQSKKRARLKFVAGNETPRGEARVAAGSEAPREDDNHISFKEK